MIGQTKATTGGKKPSLASRAKAAAAQPKVAAVLKAPVPEKKTRRTFKDSDKITVLTRPNPYESGSKINLTYALLLKAKTVGQFKQMVGDSMGMADAVYLGHAVRAEHIKVG